MHKILFLLSLLLSMAISQVAQAGSLHEAVEKGDVQLINKLLEEGISVNITNDYGRTPLMNAAWHDQVEVIKFLITNGADVNIQNAEGMTALMTAAGGGNWDMHGDIIPSGNIEAIQVLLENGADPNIKNNDGYTALDIATFDNPRLEAIEMLLAVTKQ